MTTSILWVEGSRGEVPSFIPGLRENGYLIKSVSTGKAALTHLASFDPDLAVVNAASLGTSGRRICQTLRARLNGNPILLIRGRKQGQPYDTAAHQVLVLPFTIRKLLNRVRSLAPENTAESLHLGPLTLYAECNLVQVGEGQARHLTPRLTALLHALMQRPGEVLDREQLFQNVWQTDYVGDTRTLDVHVSWLRKIIEDDPRNPQLLKTVRGVGYRLDP